LTIRRDLRCFSSPLHFAYTYLFTYPGHIFRQ